MSNPAAKITRGRSPSLRVVEKNPKKSVFRVPGSSAPSTVLPLPDGVDTSYPQDLEEKEDVSMSSPPPAVPALQVSAKSVGVSFSNRSSKAPAPTDDFMSSLVEMSDEEDEEIMVIKKPVVKTMDTSRLDAYAAPNLLLLYSAEDNYDKLSRAFEGLTVSQVAAFATRWITYNRLLDSASVYSHVPVDFKASSVGVHELATALLKQSAVTSHFFNENTPFVSMTKLPGAFFTDGETSVSTVVKGKFGFKARFDAPGGYSLFSADFSGERKASLSEVVAKFSTTRVGRLIPITPLDRYVVPSRQFLLLYSVSEGSKGLMCHAHDSSKALTANYQFVNNVEFINHPTVISAVELLAKYKSLPKDLFVVLYNHFLGQKDLPPIVQFRTAEGERFVDQVTPHYMTLTLRALFSRKGKKNDEATALLTSSSEKDSDLKSMVSEASKRSNGLIARMINPDLPIKETNIIRDLLLVKQYYAQLRKLFTSLKEESIVVTSSEVQVLQLAHALGMHVNSFTPSTLLWLNEEKYDATTNPSGFKIGGGVAFYVSSLPGLKFNPNPDSVQKTIAAKIDADQPAFIYLPSHTLPQDFIASGFAAGTDPFVEFFGTRQKLGASMLSSPTGTGFIGFSPGFQVDDNKTAAIKRRRRYTRNLRFCLHQHHRTGMQRVVDIVSGTASMPLGLTAAELTAVRKVTGARFESKKKDSVMVMTKVDEEIPGLDMSFFDA